MPGNAEPEWDVNIDCPAAEEVHHQITLLKRDKAAGPDGLQPALFKEGGKELVNSLTNILWTVALRTGSGRMEHFDRHPNFQ